MESQIQHKLEYIFNPVSLLCPKILNKVKVLHIDQFTQQTTNTKVILALSDHHIFIMKRLEESPTHILYYTQLDFQLKFQILREQWMDQCTPGLPIGIKFEREKAGETIQFLTKKTQILEQWRKKLQKRINQRNFHQLFKAKKKIGKGAFATVYLAERLTDKVMVAVKAFSKQKQFSTRNGKQALINEINVMRELDHPNIMKLQGIYQTENSLYMTLDILEGGQLNERIKNHQHFTQSEIRKVISNLLSALSHLSTKGIIHRDIKPENIMFRKQNSLDLVLCDFGLSTHANEENYLFVRCGTPGFVAPEIINIRDMSTKSQPISDVFSAGVIFHILLFGHSIFPGKKYNDVLVQNRACQFDFTQKDYTKIDSLALDLLKNMLQVDPKKRISAQMALNHPYFTNCMDIESVDQSKENKSIILSSAKANIQRNKPFSIMNQNLIEDKISLASWKKPGSFFKQKPRECQLLTQKVNDINIQKQRRY